MADEVDPYELDEDFECALVTLACGNPDLFKAIGSFLEPEGFQFDESELAMRAAQMIAKETGNGPKSLTIVAQRLARWKLEGRVTQEQIDGVMDFFDDAEDLGLPTVDDVIEEIKPILQHRVRDEAVQQAIDALGKKGDMDNVTEMLNKADRIGTYVSGTGTSLDDSAFEEIEALQFLERLPTGIDELDAELEGGSERGSLFILVGEPGSGKSVGLVQIAANACLEGHNVAYATLELSRARTLARLTSNLTGVPVNAILNGHMDKAQEKLRGIDRGKLAVEYFTPQATTLDEIKAWVGRLEKQTGKHFDVIVIDYCDKLIAPTTSSKGPNPYLDMLMVFEGFRVWMESTNRWGWSASQARRGDKKRKRIGMDDASDSQHKVRVADGVITLNKRGEGTMIEFFIAKNRNGIAEVAVGPLPTDFACSRIAPINRNYDQSRSRRDPEQQRMAH